MNRKVTVNTLRNEHLTQAWEVWLTAGWNDDFGLSLSEFITSWQASPVKQGVFFADQLVGIARANTDGVLYAMIHDVVVSPDHRSQGLGKQLVTGLVDALRAKGIRSIQLMAAQGQARFYQGLGFVRRPEGGPGMTLADRAE
ncbi:GNAT family N-acetyltransferase [Marinicella sediminis]|uniref:GNAT family N-acetyltransferase n=1 Tax=Marinicella sediminis TaxID=1792834 RepID=A0ABV7J4H7_9GAMM|nr:GNAT family N-acetyltransferase [Marinicella sediminis]